VKQPLRKLLHERRPLYVKDEIHKLNYFDKYLKKKQRKKKGH